MSVFVNDDNSIKVAGGFLVQVMPDAGKDEAISHLEKRLKEVPMVSELLLDGQKPEDMLNLLFGEENVKILDKMPVSFKCDCSKAQFSKALASISKKQLEQIINEDHHAETVCHFCKNKYEFSEDELKAILATM